MQGLHLLLAAVESLEIQAHLKRRSNALEDRDAVDARDECDLGMRQQEGFIQPHKYIQIPYRFGESIFKIIHE